MAAAAFLRTCRQSFPVLAQNARRSCLQSQRWLCACEGSATSSSAISPAASVGVRVTDEGIVIRERSPYSSPEHLVYGSVLWDSGLALAKYFAWREAHDSSLAWRSKSVLDLGTGTGIVALTLARLGATVMATDFEPEVLALLEENIQSNGLGDAMSTHLLSWQERDTYLRQPRFDMVVAADVLYSRRDRWFWRALEAHMDRAHRTVAYVASPYRKDSPLSGFFDMAASSGLRLERLEDGAGRAAGAALGDGQDVYRDSHFVTMSAELRVSAASQAQFSESNIQKIQIFRLSWPDGAEPEGPA